MEFPSLLPSSTADHLLHPPFLYPAFISSASHKSFSSDFLPYIYYFILAAKSNRHSLNFSSEWTGHTSQGSRWANCRSSFNSPSASPKPLSQSHPQLDSITPSSVLPLCTLLYSGSLDLPLQTSFPQLVVLSQSTTPAGNPWESTAIMPREIGRLTADLHLSMHSSKFNCPD
jgi:hypothetical protein